MDNIILDIDEKNLQTLSRYVRKVPKQAIELLLSSMLKEGLIEDGNDDCGKSIGEIFRNESQNMIPFLENYLGLRENSQKIIVFYAIIEAVIKSKDMDCPFCGRETETFEDGNYGKTWTVHRCLSDNCEYYVDDAPEFSDHIDDER